MMTDEAMFDEEYPRTISGEIKDTAFPVTSNGVMMAQGLTKREYFAAMALQGYMSGGDHTSQSYQERAVRAADDLIRELEK